MTDSNKGLLLSGNASGGFRRFVPGAERHDGCLVVAEVAQTHDGSLGQAHAFVDAVAAAGADAIKFQTHIAAAESTPAEPWRVRFSPQDETRYEYWQRMEFTPEQWAALAAHTHDRGLLFISSPFSFEAVDLLESIGQPLWKVASGEVTNIDLLERLARTGSPVLLSSGMSSWAELDAAVDVLRAYQSEIAVLQSATAYPCPPEQVGLNLIAEFRERWGCRVGLSDHSATIFAGLAGAALGIDVLEVHVTLSREMFGPDVAASITTDELRTLVSGIRFIETMQSHPVDKDRVATELAPMRQLFTKSIALTTALAAGTLLESEHLAAKKPGTGIPAAQLHAVIGRRLQRSVTKDQLLTEDDLDDEAAP